MARQQNSGASIALFKAERPLLVQLLGPCPSPAMALSCPCLSLTCQTEYISRNDPDVIVGYDFSQLDLDVLLGRLRDLKVDNWSRVGRLRVKSDKWPMLRSGRNTGLLGGRLLVDLTSDGCKVRSVPLRLLPEPPTDESTRSFMLTGVHRLEHVVADRDERDAPQHRARRSRPGGHAKVLRQRALDEQAADAVCHALPRRLLPANGYRNQGSGAPAHAPAHQPRRQLLVRHVSLFVRLHSHLRLTSLVSIDRNRTLAGNRAERNEYILLHRFHETGYIVPDKIASWEKKAQIAKAEKSKKKQKGGVDANDEDEPKVEVKREKFKGGLVFEPEKGLWDRYVLVMDYNSLYPSIIQEFDIDFSTIDWTAADVRLSLRLALSRQRASPADPTLASRPAGRGP